MRFKPTIAFLLSLGLVLFFGCATAVQRPNLPYPAFVQSEDIFERFLATLPGVRAIQYASDMHAQTSSNRIEIPPDWSGTTGGAAGKSLEIFVLAGQLRLSEFELGPGGYAYVPAGSLGFRLESDSGAVLLYFLDDADAQAVIRSPIILDSDLIEWQATAVGIHVKELRRDPGSGAATWLTRIEPGASVPWEASSAIREGYLVAGQYSHSECNNGRAATWQYRPGGYFQRPPGVLSGGPESIAKSETLWFLRELTAGAVSSAERCEAQTSEAN